MSIIISSNSKFSPAPYASESEFEEAVLQIQSDLFGPNRIYLDIKKKIGVRGIQENIPDGYLIDLNSKKPKLYFVENELAAHDVLRHVAVQILGFSLAFEAEKRQVKSILSDIMQTNPIAKKLCEDFAEKNNYRNIDHLLEFIVYDGKFSVLIIIDQIPERLENILAEKFAFGIDVLQVARYKNDKNEYLHIFEPFMQDIIEDVYSSSHDNKENAIDVSSLDTIVVPARDEGFEDVFIGRDCWYAIRMHSSMRQQIKYIAAYRVAPISAITHIATVQSIEPWEESGKWIVRFVEPAKEINPVVLKKDGQVKAPQAPRYTILENLMQAKTLDDIW